MCSAPRWKPAARSYVTAADGSFFFDFLQPGTYTISQAPSDEGLRLSVKREGVASSHLHEHVREGDVIEALGPRGQFTIDAALRRSAVLIGAGVGITPMVAFARHLVTEGFRQRRTRPLYLIQVARSEALRAFGDELQALVQRAEGTELPEGHAGGKVVKQIVQVHTGAASVGSGEGHG